MKRLPGSRYVNYLLSLVRAVVREYLDDGCLNTASSLTYTSLFAVVPFMTVTYTVFSILPAFSGVGEEIEAFVFDNFVPAAGAALQDQLKVFSAQARGLTVVGVVILLVTAYLTLVNIERALNRIWRVPRPRAGTTRLLVYWTMMTFGPPTLAVTVLASSYVLSLPLIGDVDVYGLRAWLVTWLPWLTSGLAFFLLFWAVPNCRVPMGHALLGAIITMLAFQGMLTLFKMLVANSDYQVVYGAFAAVPLFLTWLYLCWSLVLAGAVLVKQMGQPLHIDTRSCPPLELALRVLKRLHAAHETGTPVSHNELLSMGTRVSTVQWQLVMDRLKEGGFLAELEDGLFVLGRDLRHTTLLQLYLMLPEDAQTATMSDMPIVQTRLRELMAAAANHLNVTLEDIFDDVSPFADPVDLEDAAPPLAGPAVQPVPGGSAADGVRAVGANRT